MTDQIISQNSSKEDLTVYIDGNKPIDMKIIQSIYNEITGKTESISKTLRDNHLISYEDIQQLNRKLFSF